MEGMAFVDEKGRVLFSPAGCGEDEGYTIIQLAESGYTDLLEEIAERFANYEQRLKAYEDIGLTPKQLTEVDRLYAEKCRELADAQRSSFSGLEMVKIWAKLKKLKEYQNLEEQGKLLKLPCAVGDKVYTNTVIQGWYLRKGKRPYEVKVVFIGINGVDNCMHVTYDNGCMSQFWFSDIGKTIFLTREEAEAALKEL